MNSVALDKFDHEILHALLSEGRIAWVQLAERISLSPTACQRRVRLLEDAGVIRHYGADVDLAALGFPVKAFVAVRIERQSIDLAEAFRAAIHRYPEVRSAHMLSGDTDFMLQVVAPDLQRFGKFIQEELLNRPGIKDASSLIVLETVKEATDLPRVT